MENDLYALPLIVLIAGSALLLVSGILLGMLIPMARRWRVEREARHTEQAWQAFKKRLPVVSLEKREAHWRGGITDLMPQIGCDVLNSDGRCIGRITYVMSPMADCIYLYEIEIFKGFRGRGGYGTAALFELSRTNGDLPITPDQELNTQDALKFWKKIHKLAAQNNDCPVKGTISNSAWATESQKWAHLQFQESLFAHFKKFHRDGFLAFQIQKFPMARDVEEIRDSKFLESFQPNR